ncbi:DUF5020 family protein [Alkaliflexus imshenetskii]|jgi:hypothetical protein|uniref:DUF5020 family protein n=1 Tax=Alkaliflexus imshenetskii TaxID=286730 RepID=UPI00047D2266|nr:DUF5020 family protein [Alkaliflexus imshenetskii]
MRKFTAAVLMVLTIASVSAQNLQMHYDMGKDRGYVTTTLEMFKPDQWGSTFFFVDFDYNRDFGNSVSFAYMEISRALRFWDSPWAAQIEYNGGTFLNDAWLTGAQYTWNNADYSRIFTLQGLYKYIKDKHDASFQITGVWTMHFFERKLTFMGFADFWREESVFGNKTTDFVFLSEPQLWYNVNQHLSLGGEVEIASNFAGVEGFKVCPTVAVKWTF